MRLLLAEDHRDLADLLSRGLRHRGHAVDCARDGEIALQKALTVDYDALILDRDLPTLRGEDICRRLRKPGSPWPGAILMLSASGTVDDRVEGLQLGADDYLAKPFSFKELVARLDALQRRTGPARAPVLEHGTLRVDPAARTASFNGNDLNLTPKEFAVLALLMRSTGDVVTTEEILRSVWDEQTDPFTNAVRVTVMRLRRKLGDHAPIQTVTGAGYRVD